MNLTSRIALPLVSLLTSTCSAAAAPDSHAAPQVELDRLLAAYDAAPEGPQRQALADQVDAFAGQRYATWSRLYWHRDLASAEAEARATGRPILSLRMLGRLDQDLSCANSRFFRIALYADRQLSAYLRKHYVLHWSSERPVPVARIDFGDGRVLTRTVAGNSAHYVLDARGRPVDVLPGLYTPRLFQQQLEKAEPLARQVGALTDAEQAQQVARFHRSDAAEAAAHFAQMGTVKVNADGSSLMDAERIAVTKSNVEIPMVRTLALGKQLSLQQAQALDRTDPLWMQMGMRVTGSAGDKGMDENSRALFAALSPADWERVGSPLSPQGVAWLITRFEEQAKVDSGYNELVLHQRIHDWLGKGAVTGFEALNRRVYHELFLTPASDLWLGMATPEAFTGLPNDGIEVKPSPSGQH